MHKFLSLVVSTALLLSPLPAAANAATGLEAIEQRKGEQLQRLDSGLTNRTPAVFERFQMLVSLFLGDEQPAASSGSNASLTAQEKQALADIIKEIFEDWQQLHQDENYRQEADKAWLLLTAVLLQQPNWSDFFGGERNFRENYFASLADFYLETVKTNLVTSSTPSNQAQEQASLFGLALQNLISFQLSGYAIPKKVWEELAPRAVQSLQSAMVVESVFPILMKNGSWGALEQSMAAVQQKEWDERSGRVWGNVMKALEGAGIVGSLAFAKERLYNFDPRQDLFYGALSSFASPYWKKAPFSYSPSVFYEYYILSLPQRPPHRAASNLSVVLKKSAVAGRETIACRSGSVSMTGTEVYIYPESLAGGGSISPSKMQPIEKTPYAARKVEILERISKGQFSAYTKQAVLPELVVGGGGASMTGKTQQGMLSTNAWTEFARQLARQHPSLLKKYTVNLFDNDGEPKDENKIIWPLVYGYLQSAAKKGEKETKIALYMARKTWGDLPYVQEQNMDFVLTYYYPELACYSYKNSGEADGERSYIMTTAENVQAGRGAQMAVRLNDTVQPLASTIDWTLLVVSAPALLKGGWRLAAGSGRLIVGRPLLQGVRVSRRQYLLYSQAQLKGIVDQVRYSVGRTVKQLKKAVTVPEIPAGAPRIPSAARPVAPTTPVNTAGRTGGTVAGKPVAHPRQQPTEPLPLGHIPSKTPKPELSPISHEGLDKRLLSSLADKVKKPAALDGKPVARETPSLTVPSDGRLAAPTANANPPKKKSLLDRLFPSKISKTIDSVSEDMAYLPADPVKRTAKLKELSGQLDNLDPSAVSKATAEEMQQIARLKAGISAQLRGLQRSAAQSRNPAGIEIVRRGGTPSNPSAASGNAASRAAQQNAAAAKPASPAARTGSSQHRTAQERHGYYKDGSIRWTGRYDEKGNLVSENTYRYNKDGSLRSTRYYDKGNFVSETFYTYDEQGRLLRTSNYDGRGNLVSESTENVTSSAAQGASRSGVDDVTSAAPRASAQRRTASTTARETPRTAARSGADDNVLRLDYDTLGSDKVLGGADDVAENTARPAAQTQSRGTGNAARSAADEIIPPSRQLPQNAQSLQQRNAAGTVQQGQSAARTTEDVASTAASTRAETTAAKNIGAADEAAQANSPRLTANNTQPAANGAATVQPPAQAATAPAANPADDFFEGVVSLEETSGGYRLHLADGTSKTVTPSRYHSLLDQASDATKTHMQEMQEFSTFMGKVRTVDRASQPGKVILNTGKEQKIFSAEEFDNVLAQMSPRQRSNILRKDFMRDLDFVRSDGRNVVLKYRDGTTKTMDARDYAYLQDGLNSPQKEALKQMENNAVSSVKAADDGASGSLEVIYRDGTRKFMEPYQAKRLGIQIPEEEAGKIAFHASKREMHKTLMDKGLVPQMKLSEREIIPDAAARQPGKEAEELFARGLVRMEQDPTDMRNVKMYFRNTKGQISVETVTGSTYNRITEGWTAQHSSLLRSRAAQYDRQIDAARTIEEQKLLEALSEQRVGGKGDRAALREEALSIIEDLRANGLITSQRATYWENKFPVW